MDECGVATTLGITPWRWKCLQILPTVFDESLSYYEQICRLAEQVKVIVEQGDKDDSDIRQLQQEMLEVQEFINNWNENSEEIVKDIINKVGIGFVTFSITKNGYFIVEWGDNWEGITFSTTGFDTYEPEELEYGHLVLTY